MEELLSKLRLASIRATDDLHPHASWGYDALRWYIASGRAPSEFMRSIDSLSKRRLITLIRRASEGSMDEGINHAYKYLGLSRY